MRGGRFKANTELSLRQSFFGDLCDDEAAPISYEEYLHFHIGEGH